MLNLKEVYMKAIDRQKACPNCNGKIPLDVSQCPYCFAQVPVEASKEVSSLKNFSSQESFNSKYAPPYQPKPNLASNFLVNEEKKFFNEAADKGAESLLTERALSKEELNGHEQNKTFWPIFSLSIGGNLCVLGVLQFFFADQGVVKLEMNAEYWFLCLLVAAPLVYFGFKKLREFKEE
jgi:hypothetical protein